MSIIYEIVNVENNRKYIGCTKDFNLRMNNHFCSLRRNKHHNKKLQKDFNKLGEWCFTAKKIIEIDEEYAFELESFFIKKKNPYYNICGNNKCDSKKEESISRSELNKYFDDFFREQENNIRKMANEFKTKKFIKEQLNSISDYVVSNTRLSDFIKSKNIKIINKQTYERENRLKEARKFKDEIINFYVNEDKSISDIYRYYNSDGADMTFEVVRTILAENNVEIRDSQYYQEYYK